MPASIYKRIVLKLSGEALVEVLVGLDDTLVHHAAGAEFFGRAGQALFTQEDDGGVEIAVTGLQRLLAIQWTGARGGSQFLDHGGGDGGHDWLSFLSVSLALSLIHI